MDGSMSSEVLGLTGVSHAVPGDKQPVGAAWDRRWQSHTDALAPGGAPQTTEPPEWTEIEPWYEPSDWSRAIDGPTR